MIPPSNSAVETFALGRVNRIFGIQTSCMDGCYKH